MQVCSLFRGAFLIRNLFRGITTIVEPAPSKSFKSRHWPVKSLDNRRRETAVPMHVATRVMANQANTNAESAADLTQSLLVAAFFLLFIHLLRNKYGRGLAMIPGPWLAAYTGLWRWKDVRSGKAHQRAIELHRKYGSIVRIGPRHVSISDPREIKNIYGLTSGYTKVSAPEIATLSSAAINPGLDRILPNPVNYMEREGGGQPFWDER